ncbi:MAG: hypothetical protein P4L42_11285 [Desulfocapsaceae bacterium]|nr:hypothetical protein [Desulfocapsaceae bacterium]
MVETAAVYWESKVRIYGFREKIGLSLFTIIFPMNRLDYWGTHIQTMAEEEGVFDLVFSQEMVGECIQLGMVFEENAGGFHRQLLERAAKNEDQTSLTGTLPVEMLSFHGPHFQDRYGIASAAFDALEKADFEVLASGCTGTSVYIVLPENIARPAVEHLTKTFIIPQADHSL